MPAEIGGLTDLEEVGRGGFGVVYRARQPAFGRVVAVKVMTGARLDGPTLARFERECLAVGTVSGHPNIVRVFDAGVSAANEPYLVMDYLPGGTLAERVKQSGPLSVEQTIEVGVGLAGALETAHAAGVIHRDVKPENVLFSRFGTAALVDFGIARIASAYETSSGTISATLAHAAPEILSGADATPSADVYSLGSVLYFVLAGTAAFVRPDDESITPLIARIAIEPVPDLRVRGVPDEVAKVVEQALAKDASDRPASAAALGAALQAAAEALGLARPTMAIPAVTLAPGDAGPELIDAASTIDRVTPDSIPIAAATGAPLFDRDADETPGAEPEPQPARGGRRRLRRRPRLLVGLGLAAIALVVLATMTSRNQPDRVAASAAGAARSTSSTTTSGIASGLEPETGTAAEGDEGTAGSPTTSPGAPSGAITDPGTTTDPGSTTDQTTQETTAPPPTTTETDAGTPTTAAATVTRPGPVGSPTSRNPVTIQETGGIPDEIRVTLRWLAPTDTGGEPPTRYRIRCTLMHRTDAGSAPQVYAGTATPAPCKGGVNYPSVGGGATSTDVSASRIQDALTWLQWEVAAENSAGTGPYTRVTVVVPHLIGLPSWVAFDHGRVVGLMSTGGRKSCSAPDDDTICDQGLATGTTAASGANFVLWVRNIT